MTSPAELYFPVSAEMPESKRHLEQRTLLYLVLKLAFAKVHSIGCDQFVYWDSRAPRECLAPDAFVKLGTPDENFDSWKTWERGAPDVAVEIISDNDGRQLGWAGKLVKYDRLGVSELVRFDSRHSPPSLRVWDRVDGKLVERKHVTDSAPSRVLPGSWVVVKDTDDAAWLRLAHDDAGQQLFPTPEEARARDSEAMAQRIRELEAELAERT
jgi:Uma2 family endonuclease